MLSTVSPTYAREIQSSEFGCGLDGVLRERGADLVGILNGVDVDDWNPATDPHVEANFSAAHPEGKQLCKRTLQLEAGLPADPTVPLFGVVGRLTHQKGFDVLAHCMDRVLPWNAQFVLLGNGDRDAEHYFGTLSARRGGKFKAWLGFDNGLAHRITAGSDFLIMPSRFEPCGLSQMYAMRYGTLPIVRATGGLDDTVQQYDESTGNGTGFKFWEPSPAAIYYTVGWAVSTYYDRPYHVHRMIKTAMQQDYSWEYSAREYVQLYEKALANKAASV